MKQNYSTQVLRVVVAQICQTIGWQAVTATSLEIMVDIMDRYIKEICKTTHDYAELYNRTESNIDDLGLAFRDMGINMNEIVEYISYVEPVVPPVDVPKYPVPKESHLNFLKPGSKEVLTRPVHIHEHLPPINPPEEEPLYNGLNGDKEIDVVGVPDDAIFKRPADGNLDVKKAKTEDEGRPTREISSVMMTTSGFISPAREGKLPESKPPNLPPEYPKPTPPPVVAPLFKKEPMASSAGAIDKKLEKKLRKKNHDKEKRKDKLPKDKYPVPDMSELIPLSNINPTTPLPIPPIMPREANEQQIMAERKKELKKLKMKNKDTLGLPKKKKEKLPKAPKSSFDANKMPKFDPYHALPPVVPPSTSSQIQAHSYLTGAAHSMFPNPMMDAANPFAPSPLIPGHSLIEGKLISEPDKQKLNIFKKISSKPKEETVKSNPVMPPAMDFLSPSSKSDRFDMGNPLPFQQTFTDPIKKTHKLPKETTLTRIEDTPLNFSMPRSSDSSFDDNLLPKTPTIPRTPDMKLNQGTEKKRKRKDKEKKLREPEWNQQLQNPFMPDMSGPSNPFLQNLQDPTGLMGNFALGTAFPYLNPGLFSSGPGLIPRGPFGMPPNPFENFQMPTMDMNMVQPKPKKQKAPKQTSFHEENFMQTANTFGNIPPSLLLPSIKERFDMQPHQMTHIDADSFPPQNPQMSTFDQLMKEPKGTVEIQKMETFDLTKDSSPEPTTPSPVPIQQQQVQQSAPPPSSSEMNVAPQPEIINPDQPAKAKKKKKDKDRDKDERKKEKKKKDKKDRKDRDKSKESKKKKKEKHKDKARASMSTLDSQSTNDTDTGDNNSTSSVPKLMLKLNSPRPSTPDMHKKLLQRTATRAGEFDFPSPSSVDVSLNRDEGHGGYRDASPELVRISPLVTRPPKQKPSTSVNTPPDEINQYHHQQTFQNPYTFPPPVDYHQSGQLFYQATSYQQPTHHTHVVDPEPIQQQYEAPPSTIASQGYTITENKGSYIDADGKEVWICPACGKVDDGTPMIGCDSCDAWYHWACVGIRVEPKENEDWYCRACIARKQNDLSTDGKKKKHKKKDKNRKE